MSKLLTKLKAEVRELLPPMFYFLVALHLVAFVRGLMLGDTGISLASSASVTIAALVIGKAVLVADLLPLVRRFSDRPLVYAIVWKSFIYFIVALLFHYLERLVHEWREVGSLLAANERLLAELVWPHFWAVQIFLMTLILIFCAAREFARAVGKDALRQIFLGQSGTTKTR